MQMETQSKDERSAEWAQLKADSLKDYKPGVYINNYLLVESAEFSNLKYNAGNIKIEVAKIGSKGTMGRARVTKGEETLFDTGECRRDTMQTRLSTFLAKRIQLEAMRLAR